MYNGAGQRVKKTTPVETRIFHYDLYGHLIAETDEQGQTLAEYVYLGDEPLAMIREGENDSPTCFISQAVRAAPLQAQADTEEAAYYFHNDHLGTPQMLTDGQGLIVWGADYRPFGEVNIVVEGIESNLRFPGQYFDTETGLHYNYFRDYHPGIGRYVEPDLLALNDEDNLYAYARNNSINWIDPTGGVAIAPAAIIVGGALLIGATYYAVMLPPERKEAMRHDIARLWEWQGVKVYDITHPHASSYYDPYEIAKREYRNQPCPELIDTGITELPPLPDPCEKAKSNYRKAKGFWKRTFWLLQIVYLCGPKGSQMPNDPQIPFP